MKRIFNLCLFLICISLGLFSNLVLADTELENEALTRTIHVLDSLKPLINEAERQQDKNTRTQFQYDALRQDLEKIKTGINEKLNPITIEPRVVTPIDGDYVRFQEKHQ